MVYGPSFLAVGHGDVRRSGEAMACHAKASWQRRSEPCFSVPTP